MNVTSDFVVAFSRIVATEGGFQADHRDDGNWTDGKLIGTKYGISARSYPNEDIPNLTLERAKEIYKRDFWVEGLPFAVAYQLFDAAINSGASAAAKMLQKALGVNDDGIIGSKTRAAVNAADESALVMRFLAERLLFMARTKRWPEFGRGWARRVAVNLKSGAKDVQRNKEATN